MTNKVKFRCRFDFVAGVREFELESDSTYQTLLSTISSIAQIPQDRLQVLKGYPPREITCTNHQDLLVDYGLRGNITLIIREIEIQDDFSRQFERGAGIFIRKCVNADNSCLFSSINFLVNPSSPDSEKKMKVTELRYLVAETILSNQTKYNKAFLDQTPEDYYRWITQPNSWGGAIELDVFSHHFQVQINVVDITTLQILKFGEESEYSDMFFLVYNGAHYDPLMFEYSYSDLAERRRFSVRDDGHLFEKAIELAEEMKNCSNKFICSDCNAIFYCTEETGKHSELTGHSNYTT